MKRKRNLLDAVLRTGAALATRPPASQHKEFVAQGSKREKEANK